MLAFIGLLAFAFYSFGAGFCIEKVQNPYNEPYLSFVFVKKLENAVLETGNTISCEKDHKLITPRVELLKETPIAYTPQQRVSAYNLELKVSITVDGKSQSFSVVVPYSQPEGGLGDLPRRRAIEDAFGIIYTEMLRFLNY